MPAELDLSELEAEVARNETVDEGAKTLITRLADELEANATDSARILALAARLRTSTDGLAGAVASVPPATPPVEPPVEPPVV